MKKVKVSAAKLQLNRIKIVNLTDIEMGHVNGGGVDSPVAVDPNIFGTRVLCFASQAANCSQGSCGGTRVCGKGSLVVACIPFNN